MNLFSYFSKNPIPLTILAGPFRGASLILNPACSKRKLLGLYEHILIPWLDKVIPQIEVVWDVGAGDGYFTYGTTWKMNRINKKAHVIAFEPSRAILPHLSKPASWPKYREMEFEFIPSFVGNIDNESTITLDTAYRERPMLANKPSLIKVDVEGSEIQVLQKATFLLPAPHHWVVEVHGDHLLQPVLDIFAAAKRPVNILLSQPHWLLGSERRIIPTSWVTTC